MLSFRSAGGYWTAALAVIIGWLALGWPWLSGHATIPYDAKAEFLPQLAFLARALHTGQSPFWSPNEFGGTPQIADPQSLIFSPAILLAWLDPSPSFREFDTYVLLTLLVAGLAILLFFKDRGWHPAGATAAALATAFGASAAWRIQHIAQIQNYAEFAVCLWLLSRALNRERWWMGVPVGLAGGVMLAEAGQVSLLGAYALAGFVIWHWLSESRPWAAALRSAPMLLLATATAALIAFVPILMTYEFVEASSRSTIPFTEAARGSLNPFSLLSAFIGELYAPDGGRIPFWGPPSWAGSGSTLSQNMTDMYSGALIAVATLTIGLIGGRAWRREVRYFALGAVVFAIYAVGWFTPGFSLFYDHLPFVHLFRRPADATFLLGAMLAVLGGYLVHVAASEGLNLSLGQKWIAAGSLVGVLLFGVTVSMWRGHLFDAGPALASSAVLTGLAGLLLVNLRRMSAASPAAAIAMVAVLSTVDLSAINGPNESTGVSPERYAVLAASEHEPTIEFLRTKLTRPFPTAWRDRVELLGLGFEWPNAGLVYGFDHDLGYNPMRLAAITDGLGANDTVAVPEQRRFTPLFPSLDCMLARLMSLRYVATKIPVEQIDHRLRSSSLKLVAHTSSAYIYENPKALPRVLFASDWLPASFDRIIESGKWPAFDPLHTVLLSNDGPFPGATAPRRLNAVNLVSRVAIASYTNTVVEIGVDAEENGFVVLGDVWHPWWRATVDGKPTPVYRANVMFRAVAVPKGLHVVRFEFKPIEGLLTSWLPGWAKGQMPTVASLFDRWSPVLPTSR